MNDQEAINSVVVDLLSKQRKHNKHLLIALSISIVINIAIVISFLVYELQLEYAVESYTTETTVTKVQCENGGNNEFQTGEHATYNASQ